MLRDPSTRAIVCHMYKYVNAHETKGGMVQFSATMHADGTS